MSGILSGNFRGGHRSELLADYLLSGIGLTTPVRHQDDTGFDFYCQLADQEKGILTFGSPFILQVKSESVDSIEYGSRNPEKWKRENIDWLYKLEIPLFVGVVDKQKMMVSVYNVSTFWFIYYEAINCSLIQLVPRKNFDAAPIGRPSGQKIANWPAECGDGMEYCVDLGNPVITIEPNDFENLEILSNKKKLLREVILLEQANILSRKMQVSHFQWLHIINPNSGVIPAWYYSAGLPANIDSLYRSLTPGIVSLILSLKENNAEVQRIEELKALIKYLPPELIYSELRQALPDVFGS